MLDNSDVTASAETLVRQAGITAECYLDMAVSCIDEKFGDGFAKKNPALIGAFMATAASDYHAAMVKAGAQDIRDAVDGLLSRRKFEDLCEAMRTDHPLQGERLDGVSDGLRAIADAISEAAPG